MAIRYYDAHVRATRGEVLGRWVTLSEDNPDAVALRRLYLAGISAVRDEHDDWGVIVPVDLWRRAGGVVEE